MPDDNKANLNRQLAARIVGGYLRRNQVAPDQLAALISAVHDALGRLGKAATEPAAKRVPAVSVKRSVTRDLVICLDCGWRGKMLRRHLMLRHGLNIDQYRARWGLPRDHAMTAPAYSERRSRGVYFFREPGEYRSDTGEGPRVVRVGTHALKAGSRTTLWTRLSQHKGQANTGGGNHRGSIFRQIVGAALIKRDSVEFRTWGEGYSASREVREAEFPLERQVSVVIGNMTCLWLLVEDAAGPESLRGYIERNAIALLSNYNEPPLDPPSKNWLGHFSDRERVRRSGLWNQNHVDEACDPAFLDVFDQMVSERKPMGTKT
jgi:predicted transcriptional regulator